MSDSWLQRFFKMSLLFKGDLLEEFSPEFLTVGKLYQEIIEKVFHANMA